MRQQSMKIVSLTPGAGGMLCGSCLSDNMLAATMQRLGHDIALVPLYTPIVTDEQNVSAPTLFFGGLNVYLQQKFAVFRSLPRCMDRLLDHPRLVSLLAALPTDTDQDDLASLTLSMVRGEDGNQRKEVRRLVDWLSQDPRPDIIHFSNLLIAGSARVLKQELSAPLVVTLQGDDVFLDSLPEDYRSMILEEMQRLAAEVDQFIVHSHFYAKKMGSYFKIPHEKFAIVPLGIEASDYTNARNVSTPATAVNIGYLARICPAKGLHLLIDAFMQLKVQPEFEHLKLWVAGDLNRADRPYFETQQARIRTAGFHADFHYAGRLDRKQKIEFLSRLDLFSVPAPHQDPKGRYVLEALATGIPVVQPADGVFPELLERTGGGRLFDPGDSVALAAALAQLLNDSPLRATLAREGPQGVLRGAGAEKMAQATIDVYQQMLGIL